MRNSIEFVYQDLRYGIRGLVRNPLFSLVMIFTLALGIGANTALFSIVSAVLLRPLPFIHPDQLVMIQGAGELINLWADGPRPFRQTELQTQSLEDMALYNSGGANLSDGMVPERVLVMETTASFFTTLGSSPIQGRTYLKEEEKPGQNRVAVLSFGLWQNRYGGAPDVLSKTIGINGRNFTVIGVMPRSFQFPAYPGMADLWVPLTPAEHLIAAEGVSYETFSRLKPGVTLAGAQAEMDAIIQRLYPASRNPEKVNRITLFPLRKKFEAGARPGLLVLMGAAGFVLLIACANLANLLLSRAVVRQRETAIRRTLGADRSRLIRQWLMESLVLSMFGGAFGLFLTFWSLKGLVLFASLYLRYISEATVDMRVLSFALAVSIVTGILFGLAPAIQFSNPSLSESLKEGGMSLSSGFGRSRFRQGIIIMEVALAFVLLTGAGLLLRTFKNLWRIDPGFQVDNILTVDLSASNAKYPEATHKLAFYQQVIDRIKAIPGINAAGSVNHLPLDMSNTANFYALLKFDDRKSGPGTDWASYRIVSSDYFNVMGIPLLNGRSFTERDNLQSPFVAILSQVLAHRVFGNEDPIGKHVIFGKRTYEIVGVVGDIRHWGLDLDVDPEFYVSSLQEPSPFITIAIRTQSDFREVSSAIRGAVDQVDKDQPIYNLKAMDRVVAESLSERRFVMVLLGLFSALALLLSAVGVYGLMSFSIGQRIQEFGIRVALGAQPHDVLRLILQQGMTPVLIGIGLGILASIGLTRLLTTLLFGVRPLDPITLATVPLILIGVAMVACCLPARRATNVDPANALRCE